MESRSDSRQRAERSFAHTDPSSTQEMGLPPISKVVPIREEDVQEFDRQADEAEAAFRDQVDAEDIAADAMRQGQQAVQLPGGYAPPAPMGGRPMWAAYYFTIHDPDSGADITVSREVMIPGDAIVECRGNALIIHHEGVADTFRIGRVRPA